MIIQNVIDYVAGTHKSDTDDLADIDGAGQAKAIRVCNTSGSDVVLKVHTGNTDDIATLTFPDKFCGWEPVTITRIRSTGTTGDTASGVTINLGLQ
jgi:hypothetical protein